MNTMRRSRYGRHFLYLTGVLVSCGLCAISMGQVTEYYDLSWSVLSGGGGVRASVASSVHDALGQSVGAVSESATFHIEGGFIVSPGDAVADTVHPADLNADWRIMLGEAIAYLAGWQQGSNPIGYAIRAAYLWQNGERYLYYSKQAPPLCWELVP